MAFTGGTVYNANAISDTYARSNGTRKTKKYKTRKGKNKQPGKKGQWSRIPRGSRPNGVDRQAHIETATYAPIIDDGERHLADWHRRMSAVMLNFKQQVRQGKIKLRYPLQLKLRLRPNKARETASRPHVSPKPILPTSGGDAGASVVTVGVESTFWVHNNRPRARLNTNQFPSVHGITTIDMHQLLNTKKSKHCYEKCLSTRECNFIQSHPKVFRYGDGRTLQVDLHSLFDSDDGILMSTNIVQRILHTTLVESKMTDKHDKVRAIDIEIITGKGNQVLYSRVKRLFEDWVSMGCSSVMRRNIKCR